jgi:hypothetical protein
MMAKAAGFKAPNHQRADQPSMLKDFVVTPDDLMVPSRETWWPERSPGMLASATKGGVRSRFNPRGVTRLQHRRVPRYPPGDMHAFALFVKILFAKILFADVAFRHGAEIAPRHMAVITASSITSSADNRSLWH